MTTSSVASGVGAYKHAQLYVISSVTHEEGDKSKIYLMATIPTSDAIMKSAVENKQALLYDAKNKVLCITAAYYRTIVEKAEQETKAKILGIILSDKSIACPEPVIQKLDACQVLIERVAKASITVPV
jgi:hypothetical protein